MESVTNFFKGLYEKLDAYVKANPTRAGVIGGTIGLLLLSAIIKLVIDVPLPHVSLAAQPLMLNGPAWFTNSLVTTVIVDIIIVALAFAATRNMSIVPSGLQNLMETLLEFIQNLAESVAGKSATIYLPWLATLFLFILISNYSGLIPFVGSFGFYHPLKEAVHARNLDGQLAMADGKLILIEQDTHSTGTTTDTVKEGDAAHAEAAPAEGDHTATGEAAAEGGHGTEELVPLFRAPTADLSTTFALAIATMFMVQYHGYRALGGKYFRKFAFWSPSGTGFMKGINGFVMFLEVISEISRILTFSFRLFGNIFAGEVVLAVMAYLVAFIVPVAFYGLEVMVGAIQAFVFMMLALVFFNMATISHDDHSEEHHH